MRTDDRLYLYSDGVAEAAVPSGEQFGGLRIMNAMDGDRRRAAADGGVRVRADVERWCGSGGVHDDISILTVQKGDAGESRAGEPYAERSRSGEPSMTDSTERKLTRVRRCTCSS